MKKRIIIISSIIILALVIIGIYSTFASDETTVRDNTYNITLTDNSNELTVPAGSSKTVIYKVTNTNKGKVKYGIAYLGDNITVKVYDDSSDEITGYIDYGETKFIKLYIENTSDSESSVSIKTVLGYENGGELEGTPAVPSEYTLVSEVYTAPINFVDYLTNLYMNASPAQATVANNGINYYYAPTVNMMNDGMNTSHVWEDGANTGNIRYYGSSPANYIDIGDRDASGNVIPWRIIGVFKNMKLSDGTTDTLVKIISNENNTTSPLYISTFTNDWHNNQYQITLNNTFYPSFSQDVKDKIERVKWNIGGHNSEVVYSNDIYKYERMNEKCFDCTYETIWEGYVAFPYPSDYGYASDLTKCSNDLSCYSSDATNCTETNWIYTRTTKPVLWLLTPASDDLYNKLYISNGNYTYLNVDPNATGVGRSAYVLQVLYLKSDLKYVSGDGSSVESAYVVK